MKLTDFILDLLFPKRCLSCNKFGKYLCYECNKKIKNIEINICPVCEKPSIDGITHPKCKNNFSIDGLISYCQYEGVVKKIIHKIKYDPFISDAVDEIVTILYSSSTKNPAFQNFLKEKPIIIPVPLHKSRLRWRGYNHSAIIGKALAEKWNLQIKENILFRIKKTRPQVELKGKGRIENVKNAFAVNHLTMQPFSHFIIIDDVWTTGSTLKTCATLLKRNGAKTVWGLTIAR